jgi:hypothetical protein
MQRSERWSSYVDENEPMLAKMAAKREAGYRALGYDVTRAGELFTGDIDGLARMSV